MNSALGVNARGCRPTPSSRWRTTTSSPRKVTGEFTDMVHFVETHLSWGYYRWHERHWDGASSRASRASRNSTLKSRVETRVMHIFVFPMSWVTVCLIEGDAMMDESDACLISQTVINISRFHFCYLCPVVKDIFFTHFPWARVWNLFNHGHDFEKP